MLKISASTYNQFRSCPRLYYWSSVVKLDRIKQDGARRFGTLYHAGLEEWWKAMDGGDVPWRDKDAALVLAINGIHANAKHIDTDPFEVARALAMITAYHARYFELEFESVAINSTEVWYELPLLDADDREVPGWLIVGKKDAIKRFVSLVKPVEHKTTSQEINGGSDYWKAVAINTQVSLYIDASCRTGHQTDRLLYDVSRKPGEKPQLATPVEKRKFTAGKGCKECGGRAGGKLGVLKGTGKIVRLVVDAGKKKEVQVDCEPCNGTGWVEAPKLYAKQRILDETHDDFRLRVTEEIASDPDMYFRMADAIRTPDQIRESRHDVFITTGEMGALLELARQKSDGDVTRNEARMVFPKNTQQCTNMYGRSCDYIDICSGGTNPWESSLFQIRKRDKPKDKQADLPMEQR